MSRWSWTDNKLILEQPEVEGSFTLRQNIRSCGRVGLYIGQPLFSTSFSENIDQVPPSILTVPILATLVPVVWVAGAKLFVPEVDKTFYESLERVKKVFAEYFPGLPLNGEIIPGRIVDNSTAAPSLRKGMLFSGGVDSTATLIRKRDERPVLITVQGSDVRLDSMAGWEKIKRSTMEVGNRYGLDSVVLSSNFRQIINYKALDYHYRPITLGWWEGIHSSLGLAGLCAPISDVLDIGQLYVASCEGTILPWNTHAWVVENTSWGRTGIEFEGKELMRQSKLELIAGRIQAGEKDIKLRVCYETQSGDNCGQCKKCALTALGLLLEGVEPQAHGIAFKQQDLDTYRTKIESREWDLRLNRGSWGRLQRAIATKKDIMVPYSVSFFTWLSQIDIDSITTQSQMTPTLKFKAIRKKYFHDPYFIFRRYMRAWHASVMYSLNL